MTEQLTDQTEQPTESAEHIPESDTGADSTTGQSEAGQSGSDDAPATKKSRGRKAGGAKKTRTVELTLTVTGTAEGEWQADLMHSGKRVVQGVSIPAASVAKAAAELHEDISETIQSVIDTAREQHEAKLAELEAEVERVRKALSELES